MQHIHEFASGAVIWLGIADRDSDLAMDSLGQVSVELQSTLPSASSRKFDSAINVLRSYSS